MTGQKCTCCDCEKMYLKVGVCLEEDLMKWQIYKATVLFDLKKLQCSNVILLWSNRLIFVKQERVNINQRQWSKKALIKSQKQFKHQSFYKPKHVFQSLSTFFTTHLLGRSSVWPDLNVLIVAVTKCSHNLFSLCCFLLTTTCVISTKPICSCRNFSPKSTLVIVIVKTVSERERYK